MFWTWWALICFEVLPSGTHWGNVVGRPGPRYCQCLSLKLFTFFFGIKFLIMIYLTAYICRLILFQILTTPKKSHLYSLLVFRTCCWMVLLGLQLPTWISYLSNMISLTLKNLNGCLWVYSLSSVLFSSCSQVGMATNIPPHNLGELVDALSVLIHNPEATVSILLVKHHYLMCSFPFCFWT